MLGILRDALPFMCQIAQINWWEHGEHMLARNVQHPYSKLDPQQVTSMNFSLYLDGCRRAVQTHHAHKMCASLLVVSFEERTSQYLTALVLHNSSFWLRTLPNHHAQHERVLPSYTGMSSSWPNRGSWQKACEEPLKRDYHKGLRNMTVTQIQKGGLLIPWLCLSFPSLSVNSEASNRGKKPSHILQGAISLLCAGQGHISYLDAVVDCQKQCHQPDDWVIKLMHMSGWSPIHQRASTFTLETIFLSCFVFVFCCLPFCSGGRLWTV